MSQPKGATGKLSIMSLKLPGTFLGLQCDAAKRARTILIGIGGAMILLVTASALTVKGEVTKNPPGNFSFKYFESVQQERIVPEAQSFVDQRFPPGSNLKEVIKELTDAGAKCARGEDYSGIYYACYYSRGFLVQTEWRIIVRPDKEENNTVNITVVRGFTGP